MVVPAATIRMGSKAMLGGTLLGRTNNVFTLQKWSGRSFSVRSGLQPPDLPRLAETARISLTPNEVQEFAPKIQQVVDWFGQLQNVDLQSLKPAIRADSEGENFRGDVPEIFENREGIISGLPNYEEPFIKVPKVLNTE